METHMSKIQRSITAMATAAAISLPLMSVAQAHGQEQPESHKAIYNTVQNPSTPQYVINPFGARRLGAEQRDIVSETRRGFNVPLLDRGPARLLGGQRYQRRRAGRVLPKTQG